MNPISYRELEVLEALSTDSNITQRRLAERLQVALGLANLMIRRCVKKGYVKAVNIQKNRIRYLLTPKGLVEKTRLTYAYLEYSLYLYRRVREVLKETLSRVAKSGGRRIVFFGGGEIAEIAYLTVKELGLQLVAVIDEQAVGARFMDLPVSRLAALPGMEFDCGIISSLNGSVEDLRRTLRELGVPERKLVVIEQDRTVVRAVPQGAGESAWETLAAAEAGAVPEEPGEARRPG
jgi:DNA-binding MarR family transcriptional regulator